jgi:competence protein ComEA
MKPLVFHKTIGIEPARQQLIQQRIDPNTATWPELARLPDIGETLAKRIVAYRREKRPMFDPAPVFSALQDLDPIKGIGPKTLAEMEPFLKFSTSQAQTGR